MLFRSLLTGGFLPLASMSQAGSHEEEWSDDESAHEEEWIEQDHESAEEEWTEETAEEEWTAEPDHETAPEEWSPLVNAPEEPAPLKNAPEEERAPHSSGHANWGKTESMPGPEQPGPRQRRLT